MDSNIDPLLMETNLESPIVFDVMIGSQINMTLKMEVSGDRQAYDPAIIGSRPVRNLWIAVINQAIEDLFYMPRFTHMQSQYCKDKLKEAMLIRRSARSFLFSNSPMFQQHRTFVFEMAGIALGLNLRQLRKRANEFEAKL